MRCKQVVLFCCQAGHPGALLGALELGQGLFRQRDEVLQVTVARGGSLAGSVEPLLRVLAHRLQHPVARRRLALLIDHQQRLVMQPGQ